MQERMTALESNCKIELVNVTKRFGKVIANDSVNLTIEGGKVLCLLGENGSGKTTLMNVLSGIYMPEQGHILKNGVEIQIRSPKDAFDLKIGMIHQHFKLVPSLTVYENILLGAEITQKKGGMKTPFIDQKEEIKRVEKLIQENHLELNATEITLTSDSRSAQSSS